MAEVDTSLRLGRLDDWARIAILALTLVLCCAFGLVTPYLLAIIGMVLAVRMAMARELLAAYREATAKLFVFAFAVLVVCYAITARQPGDVAFAINFIMLLLFAPIRAELAKAARPGNARRIANLAALGTVVALGVALFRLVILGELRADSIMFGAILLANTAVLLGFLSVIGTLTEGPNRWAYLLTPLLGVVVASLTGSRGPMIAILPLIVVAAIFVARHHKIAPWRAALSATGYAAVCAAIVWSMQGRATTLFSAIGQAAKTGAMGAGATMGARGSEIADSSTQIRLDLYRAGYQAFLENPIFGHGWARLMSAAYPYLPADKTPYAELPQLHNDIVNFSVAAGLVGVAVYLLLLAAPLAGVLRTPRDSQFNVRLYGGIVLLVAYACDGLTDLMLGFEFHTALYVCLTAVLIGYCQDNEPHASAR
ncbi:MAG: O-antigen ligase family protein [Roseiflexaceae bacterium]